MASVDSGTYGTLRLEIAFAGNSAVGLWTDISWAAYHEERVAYNASFNNSGVAASVAIAPTNGTVFSGAFTFDWRPGGLQSVLIASGVARIPHNADGTPPANLVIAAAIGDTGSNGSGRGTSITIPIPVATLKVLPGTPTGCSAARVSDTSINVSWAQASASNGQPTTNTIRRSINGGAFADVVTIAPATSAAIAAAANQKIVYSVRAANSEGSTAWSASSAPVYTTPAAPSSVAAAKVGTNIDVSWASNVAFIEHQHVVQHGVDVAGVITWDAGDLASVAAGTSSHTHVAPNPADRHVYRVRARNTDVAALASAPVQSNVVQLLTPPNAPTLAPLPAFLNRAIAQPIGWTHNSIDTSPQTAYEFGTSTNGGTTWGTTGKVLSAVSLRTLAANAYAANAALTIRVRTWGSATTGGSEGTGASPWSSLSTVTFKSAPTAAITSPANGSTYTQASVTAVLTFAQAEAATFVSAALELYQGATLLETLASTTLAGSTFTTRAADGVSYTIKAKVTDSNGLISNEQTSTFAVDYIEPVAALAAVEYLPASGIAQISLTIPAASGGFAAATTVSIDRLIDGVSEVVVSLHPAGPSLTFLDTTPTIHGTNVYRITTRSVDGATTVVVFPLVTTEDEWAFISKGAGFQEIITFQLAPGLKVTPTVDSALVKASGRRRPIGLYTNTGGLLVAGAGALALGFGSTAEDIEEFLLLPGKACYRDPTGRRMFGMASGALSLESAEVGSLEFSVTETD